MARLNATDHRLKRSCFLPEEPKAVPDSIALPSADDVGKHNHLAMVKDTTTLLEENPLGCKIYQYAKKYKNKRISTSNMKLAGRKERSDMMIP